MNEVWVGVDVSKENLDVAVRPGDEAWSEQNNQAGIKGFEVTRMIRRGPCLTCKPRVQNEVPFVNKLFDVFAVAA